jgi:transcriptional regulator with XRE-family HTH domain
MDIREVFARNLRKARNARCLSQEGLAHEANVDRTYVSALERGVYNATIVMVAKLAKALDVEPSELLRGGAKPKTRKRKSP